MDDMFALNFPADSSNQDDKLEFSFDAQARLPGPVLDRTFPCQNAELQFSYDPDAVVPKATLNLSNFTTDGKLPTADMEWGDDKILQSLPLSDYQLNLPSRSSQKPPVPDISKGLGRRQTKKDVVSLAKYVQAQLEILVYEENMYVFDPPCWNRLGTAEAHRKILETLQEVKDVDSCISTSEIKEIYRWLCMQSNLQYDGIFEPPDGMINFRDGTYDLLRNEFYRYDPDDHFTTYVDVTWAEICKNPRGDTFERFVSNISAGDSLVRTQLLELVGILLTGTQVKHFFVLLGESNTGKTQFGRFLGELVGRENAETIRDIGDFGDKWTVGSLEGKLLATCLDLPDKPLPKDAVGTIKQLTGDDPIKGEVKRENPHTFYKKPLLLCAGNHPIRIQDMGKEKALLNRMVVIPFRNPVSESSMRQALYKDLLEEAPYIIREAIRAYQELAARNWQVTRAEIPAEYQPEEGKPLILDVQQYVQDFLTFSPESECLTDDLWNDYCAVGVEHSLQQLSKITFSRILAHVLRDMKAPVQDVKRACGTASRGYKGIVIPDR